jgi:RNA polymerase sigma factor (sigma-70 family)
VKNTITSKKFEDAYNNQDNIYIIKHVCNKYKRLLDFDELQRCGQMALWKCLQAHSDSEINNKFTTSLYKHTVWQCKKQLKENNRIKPHKIKLKTMNSIKTENRDINKIDLEDILESLPSDLSMIMKMKYLYGYSNRDIGHAFNVDKETVRNRINDAIQLLKQQKWCSNN